MEIDPNDFKQLIGLLQKLVEKTSETPETKQESTSENLENVSTKPIKQRKSKVVDSSRQKSFTNKFLEMRESSMHKEDIEIDKKLQKFPPTQRARKFQAIDVICRVCGKKEHVSPSLVESRDRYKCNKCSSSPG